MIYKANIARPKNIMLHFTIVNSRSSSKFISLPTFLCIIHNTLCNNKAKNGHCVSTFLERDTVLFVGELD